MPENTKYKYFFSVSVKIRLTPVADHCLSNRGFVRNAKPGFAILAKIILEIEDAGILIEIECGNNGGRHSICRSPDGREFSRSECAEK